MKTTILLVLLSLAAGCASTHTDEQTVLMVNVPDYLPTYSGEMTVAEAAAVLDLALPVKRVRAAGLEDGGTVEVSILGVNDKGVAFHRSPWAWGNPVYFYLDAPTPTGKPVRLEYDDKRLKALSVVLLDWVDRRFSNQEQTRIRMGQPPEDEMNAGEILHLFRKEE